MARYYLTFGYPLMVAASTIVDGYIVENGETGKQTLPNDIAAVWANLLCCGFSDDKTAVEKLAGRGLLYAGASKEEILMQCRSLYPIRQGIGSTLQNKDKEGKENLYYSVRLGKENYTLSDFQRRFWVDSNGKKTVGQILDSIWKESSHLNTEEMANQIFILIKFGLLFIER